MPKACLNHLKIVGLHTVVGSEVRRIDEETEQFGGDAAMLARIKKTIGLDERRVVAEGVTSLDLCRQATSELLGALDCPAGTLDAILFVTQTPDYFQPCNAALMHGALGLPKTVAAFDVNLGCSGYVYALYLAGLMLESGGCQRVLVLAGDTISRHVNRRDRALAPLFGDAGAATLLERAGEARPAYFSLNTDGSKAKAIHVPAGAFRKRPSELTRVPYTDADGNTRSEEELYMNGADVFNFSIKEEPPAIREILEFAGTGVEEIDAVVFHQANKYIIENIARRLKLPPEKAPSGTVGRYGNQSGASIPGALCDVFAGRLREQELHLVLSGFGVGLSWASACLRLGPLAHAGLSSHLADAPVPES